MPAQSEESGSRSATMVSARVPASGSASGGVYSRMAKTAVSGEHMHILKNQEIFSQGITIVHPPIAARMRTALHCFHPFLLRFHRVQTSFPVKMMEKYQIEIVSVTSVPSISHPMD